MSKELGKILITGGTGFLGRHLARKLLNDGMVSSRNLVVSSRKYEPLSEFEDNYVQFDLMQLRPGYGDTMWLNRFDTIFHLAAKVGGIGANQDNSGLFCYQNLQMGMNLMETVRLGNGLDNRQTKIIIAGTVCSYGLNTPVPFNEIDLWNEFPEPTNAYYGVAKKTLLVMAQGYRKQYGCNFVMPLMANMFGPEDNTDLQNSHVIPAMIRKFVEAKQNNAEFVDLWGDGSPTREFLYVEDAAEALIRVAQDYDEPEPINIGVGQDISMKDLAEMIAGLVDYRGKIRWDASKPNGQPKRRLDVSRARDLLGWEAKWDLKSGLKKTIEWYQRSLTRV